MDLLKERELAKLNHEIVKWRYLNTYFTILLLFHVLGDFTYKLKTK